MTNGERVNEVRKSLGLTLEKFGEKLGVTKTTISRIENGITSPTLRQLETIAAALDVKITVLFDSEYK